jgi:5S rRNA maturation endonuclease (ribonuclease M5)
MQSLSEHILESIDPQEYFNSVLPGIEWPSSGAEGRVLCCFHEDKNTASLSLNPDNGKWYCHGCGKGGKTIISFHAALRDTSMKEACVDLFHRHIHPIIPDKQIRVWRRALKRCPSARRYITRQRHIPLKSIRRFELGYSNERIVFPIRNEFGLCINAKFYSPLAHKNPKVPKMRNFRRQNEPRPYGSPTTLYPLPLLLQKGKENETVVVCEGEWDTLLMISHGLVAVTTTNGAKSWPNHQNKFLQGRDLFVAYDNDKDGDKYASKPIKALRNLAKSIRRVRVPKLSLGKGKTTKDLSDVYEVSEELRTRKAWRLFLKKKSSLIVTNTDSAGETEAAPDVPVSLDLAADAKFFKKRITVDAMITGKASSPFLVPQKVRISCSKECENCPLTEGKEFKEINISPADPEIMDIVDNPKSVVRRILLGMSGLPQEQCCHHNVEVVKSSNVEQVYLIPSLDDKSAQYCLRDAFYAGHGLRSNRTYRFQGLTIPHPEDQRTTHLFDKAVPVQDEIDQFSLSPETARALEVFRPRNLSVMAHLMGLAEWQSRHVTKILERPDVHLAVDLAYHSVREFDFNGEHVPRGMLDILIVGDTRCGKGYVTERLMKFFKLGEIASGEMCSFAGLFGGVQNLGKRFVVTWGLIPLNHNRLVVIDEMSALTEVQIGNMSRVRSEGIAEINKIVRESTQANARLIWLSNARSGREMRDHNSGVQVIKELVGANEDIARFDFALSVANNEVDPSLINQLASLNGKVSKDADLYPAGLCRSLLLWAWSRDRYQILFTSKATKEVINQAIQFGKRYSSKIPLVQAENIRVKIAKISAAVAALVFSASEDAEQLIVKQVHVLSACQFLEMIYSKPSMGYDVFSRNAIATSTIADTGPIALLFDAMGPSSRDVRRGLIEMHRITPDMLADYVGDVAAAKGFIGDLVKLHCLSRIESGGWYLKNPSFTQWLKSKGKS